MFIEYGMKIVIRNQLNLYFAIYQLQKFINSYEDNPRLDGEQLLYLYNAIVEVQDNKTLEMFNSFAKMVAGEYDRKQNLQMKVIRNRFIKR